MKSLISVVIILLLVTASGVYYLQKQSLNENNKQLNTASASMQIFSPSFDSGQPIPDKFTCKGQNISPQISISSVPREAKSLALVMYDPDAPGGTWFHWMALNLEPYDQQILEGKSPQGAVLGKNSAGKNAYSGPCPRSGTHRYFFKLMALNEKVSLSEGYTYADLSKIVDGKVISESTLFGTYGK